MRLLTWMNLKTNSVANLITLSLSVAAITVLAATYSLWPNKPIYYTDAKTIKTYSAYHENRSNSCITVFFSYSCPHCKSLINQLNKDGVDYNLIHTQRNDSQLMYAGFFFTSLQSNKFKSIHDHIMKSDVNDPISTYFGDNEELKACYSKEVNNLKVRSLREKALLLEYSFDVRYTPFIIINHNSYLVHVPSYKALTEHLETNPTQCNFSQL